MVQNKIITSSNDRESNTSINDGDQLYGVADGSEHPLLEPIVQHQTCPSSQQYTSCSSAVFLTVNALLGAGMLNIPCAFNESGGILYSFFVHCFLVFFVISSLLILTHSADMIGAVSYQQLIGAFCGNKILHLCTVFIILYCYGSCLTFVIVIGDQFDRIFLSLYGNDFCYSWYLNRNFTMFVCSTILILPFSFSKKIDFLKYVSLFGFVSTFYIIFLACYDYFRLHSENVDIKMVPDSWPELFYVTPVICFSYQCQLTWVPTYAGMKHHNGCKTNLTIFVSIFICFIAYNLIAFFGLMTFGSNGIKQDLMSNYDAKDIIALIGIILLIAKTVTIYPLMLFCGRVAVEDFLIKLFKLEHNSSSELFRRTTIVTVWFFSTIVVAILIPNLSTAIKILGSMASLFVFIFPGICCISMVLYKDPNLYFNKNKMYIILASFLIILGVFILSLTIARVIQEDFFSPNLTKEKIQLCSY